MDIESEDDGPHGFGHAPSYYEPDHTILRKWYDSLVVGWDLSNSTTTIMAEGGMPHSCWEAQADVMQQLPGWIDHVPADFTVPTGDGFFWIFDLERFKKPPNEGWMELLTKILNGLITYQSHRASIRPFTDAKGVSKMGNLTVLNSNKLDGRFGISRGFVEIRNAGSTPRGPWLTAVGRPLFEAARLLSLAPDGGLLVNEDCVPRRIGTLDDPSGLLAISKEVVSPKGLPPMKAWRLAPKALDSPPGGV